MNEVREAAERLLKFYSYPDGGSGAAYPGLTGSDAMCALANDALKSARYVVEQNPADDEEAIDEAWLNGQGFYVGPLSVGKWYAERRGEKIKITLHQDGECLLSDYYPDGGITWPVKITTRRALRALLRGMGHKAKG